MDEQAANGVVCLEAGPHALTAIVRDFLRLDRAGRWGSSRGRQVSEETASFSKMPPIRLNDGLVLPGGGEGRMIY